MKLQITHRLDSSKVLFKGDADSILALLKMAISSGANLSGANLYSANLSGANLSGANLYSANLSGANLYSADLSRADLSGANLYSADLSGANLSGANLYSANLSGANLYSADLSRADLSGANLYSADLSGANLYSADLSGANLSGALNADLVIARTRILGEGDLIGWKKCQYGKIVKLLIPKDAKRSHAFGRKCRAEYADVLEISEGKTAKSNSDTNSSVKPLTYKAGERVVAHEWCEDFTQECAAGIHFYITEIEAKNH